MAGGEKAISSPSEEAGLSVSSVSLSRHLCYPPHLTPPPTRVRAGRGLVAGHPVCMGTNAGQGLATVSAQSKPESKTPHPHGPRGAGSAQWAERRAGTRRAQAAVGISALAVLLLLELGHQAELPAAAAFGQIGGRVLRCRGRDADGQSRARAERAAPDALVPAAPLGRWPRVHWGVLRPVKSGFTRITVYFSTFCFSLYNVHSPHDDKAL